MGLKMQIRAELETAGTEIFGKTGHFRQHGGLEGVGAFGVVILHQRVKKGSYDVEGAQIVRQYGVKAFDFAPLSGVNDPRRFS